MPARASQSWWQVYAVVALGVPFPCLYALDFNCPIQLHKEFADDVLKTYLNIRLELEAIPNGALQWQACSQLGIELAFLEWPNNWKTSYRLFRRPSGFSLEATGTRDGELLPALPVDTARSIDLSNWVLLARDLAQAKHLRHQFDLAQNTLLSLGWRPGQAWLSSQSQTWTRFGFTATLHSDVPKRKIMLMTCEPGSSCRACNYLPCKTGYSAAEWQCEIVNWDRNFETIKLQRMERRKWNLPEWC
jgi:hypothetical protein